ncbi:hypothetical protein JZO82_01315 [Vagococcus fluvialis]|uniref:hypothetical protein n=1 Tax=Vagococcus fluvialis TaxID=2738 RepID=UPI001A8D4975|nr:hypothetical protein [Vagococcus fluvialis]MBO0427789.1 hypothetical protein [Vagococcus fluvialis]
MTNFIMGRLVVTRVEITSFTKILFLMFISLLVFWLVGSILSSVMKKRYKKQKKNNKIWYLINMVVGIISEILLLLTGATLFIMLTLLATIEIEVALKEYALFIILVAIFSGILAYMGLVLLSRVFLKKKKRRKIKYSEYIVTLCIVSSIIFVAMYLLFPTSFKGTALIFIISYFFIFLVGILFQSLSYQSREAKRKEKRKKSKKTRKKKIS